MALVIRFYLKPESYDGDLEGKINRLMDENLTYAEFSVFGPDSDTFAEIRFSEGWAPLGENSHEKEIRENINEYIQNNKSLIFILKLIWNSVNPKPVYGHGDHEISVVEEFDEKSISHSDIKLNAYWMNFYGKDLVNKIGKEKILKTNSENIWKSEDLEDGGILVIMSPLPFTNWPDSYKFLSEKEKKELGLI